MFTAHPSTGNRRQVLSSVLVSGKVLFRGCNTDEFVVDLRNEIVSEQIHTKDVQCVLMKRRDSVPKLP